MKATLQQLRYILRIAETGSITEAARQLYVSQPSLSEAVKELERELGFALFNRSRTGVTPSKEGVEFLGYARQVVQQMDLLNARYEGGETARIRFCVSSQHYNFVANAFADLAERLQQERYELILNETQTHQVIEDVRNRYADLGILYLSNANRSVMTKAFSDARVAFHPLFTAKPHVFLQRSHPLATRDSVTLDDLAPYPRINFVQGAYESANFAEELFSFEPCDKSIKVSDRAAVVNFMVGLNAYTISSGIFPRRLHGDAIISVPLAVDEVMGIGYLLPLNAQLGNLGRLFVDRLERFADSADGKAAGIVVDKSPDE